jgi:hypothetical protein
LYGAILSGRELHEFSRLRHRAAAQYPEAVGNDQLPFAVFGEFFEQVENSHLIPPRESPLISRFYTLDSSCEDPVITVSPHAVVRQISQKDGEDLLAVNMTSCTPMRLPAEVTPILEKIHSSGISVSETDDYVEHRTQFSVKEWKPILSELCKKGILLLQPAR